MAAHFVSWFMDDDEGVKVVMCFGFSTSLYLPLRIDFFSLSKKALQSIFVFLPLFLFFEW